MEDGIDEQDMRDAVRRTGSVERVLECKVEFIAIESSGLDIEFRLSKSSTQSSQATRM